VSNLYRTLFYVDGKDSPERKDEVVRWVFSQMQIDQAFKKAKKIYKFSKDFWLEHGDIPTDRILIKSLKSESDKQVVKKLAEDPFPTLNETKHLFKEMEEMMKKEEVDSIIRVASSESGKEGVSADDISRFLMGKMMDLEDKFQQTLISGDITKEEDKIIGDYDKAKNDEEVGSPVGFAPIDDATRGVKKGDLWLVSAYTSEGKSMFLTNLMWLNSVKFGRNVVYASGEMPRSQVRQWIMARHSQHEDFADVGTPLGITEIRDGALNEAEESFYKDTVVRDLTTNKKYGRMEVFQIYPGMTPEDLYRILKYYRSQFEIDLFIIDMVQHLSTADKKSDWRVELQETIKRLKQIAITFNEGEALGIVSGYQVSRGARDEAEKSEEYTLKSLAYTAEAERSADVSLWILRKESYKKLREVKIGMNKNRGGYIMKPFMAMERYDKAFVGEYPEGFNSPSLPANSREEETNSMMVEGTNNGKKTSFG